MLMVANGGRVNTSFIAIQVFVFLATLSSSLAFSPTRSAIAAFPTTVPTSVSFIAKTTTTLASSTTNDATSDTDLYDETMAETLTKKVKEAYSGKTVFLTGASGGLGKSLALQLSHWKVKRLILSARKLKALEEVAQECQAIDSSIEIEMLTCDLSNPQDVTDTANKALDLMKEKYNDEKIDILINNGGVSSRSRFLDTDVDVDAKVMQINFLSGAALAKAFVPSMIQKKKGSPAGGRIIWISSLQGLLGIPQRSSYAASKFAVQGYTESIRAELKSNGVSVHTVSPGYIRTGLSLAAMTGNGGTYGQMDATTAAGADPQEVAAQLLQRIAAGEVDFTIAASFSSWVATWLRFLFPSLLRMILVKRYEKAMVKDKKD